VERSPEIALIVEVLGVVAPGDGTDRTANARGGGSTGVHDHGTGSRGFPRNLGRP
jgi:hypothetical protein